MDSDYFLLQKQGNNKQNKRKRGLRGRKNKKQKDKGEGTHQTFVPNVRPVVPARQDAYVLRVSVRREPKDYVPRLLCSGTSPRSCRVRIAAV